MIAGSTIESNLKGRRIAGGAFIDEIDLSLRLYSDGGFSLSSPIFLILLDRSLLRSPFRRHNSLFRRHNYLFC
ncbi:unnamed protein product [Meloidogyne enterolobii]|uniref:Uncharacterized protein n=1 Tax=Meloidogyne enterolobii TaxID=390850 RepID=A0ACB1B671_MELEN